MWRWNIVLMVCTVNDVRRSGSPCQTELSNVLHQRLANWRLTWIQRFLHLLRSEWINSHWWSRLSESTSALQRYKIIKSKQTLEPVVSRPLRFIFSASLKTQSVPLVVDHLVQKYAHTHTHALQLSTPICSCLPISQRLSWEKNFSPAALLLLTPASFRYDNLVNPTKTVYMPGNGTFKWLTTCYLCCLPRCCKTEYQKIILRRRGPLSLHGSRGLFCTWALEEAARQDLVIEQKSIS